MAPGRLITIEGIDGAGKSTLAESLCAELGALGAPVELIREPGGVELSERIRALVGDPRLLVAPRSETLLYAAARAQLVEELLEPALARGALLLLDRFSDSSLAYQGGGRGLGIEQVAAIDAFARGSLTPDRTLLLRVPPAVGRERSRQAGRRPDRIELEQDDFFARVADAYDRLADAQPQRIRVIDAKQTPARVLADALAAIADLLEGT
jgi:dTMP kinase